MKIASILRCGDSCHAAFVFTLDRNGSENFWTILDFLGVGHVLKHARNWSFEALEREVRANLIYRDFTRLGTEKVPDAKVLAKIAKVLGPEVVQELHGRIVELAKEAKLVSGRKMRVDTTVVETPIHYPTDMKRRRTGSASRALSGEYCRRRVENESILASPQRTACPDMGSSRYCCPTCWRK
jgi:hypothetical protein